MSYQFSLSVTHLQDHEYLIRTEKVAPFVPIAEERRVWPVEEWLKQAQILMNDPILLLLKNQNENSKSPLLIPKISQSERDQAYHSLISFGQTLYDALFFGTVRDSWLTAQSLAQSQKSTLHFRLALKHEPLLSIPWEVLHPSDIDSFRPIVTGTHVAFSRNYGYRLKTEPILMESMGDPNTLRILIVISSPNDLEKLALKKEVALLQEELKINSTPEMSDQEIVFKVLENPGREELARTLEQGQYHVFHYAGHSNIGSAGGNIYLVNQKTGLTESCSGEDLAGLLDNNHIKMAVFNSCRSGDTGLQDNLDTGSDVNLAKAMVKKGIPAVLAMVAPIPDQVALTFSRLLYRNLNEGYTIDKSLSRARQGLLSAYGSNLLYWALPVLYLHPDFNGVLISRNDPKNNHEFSDDSEPWYYQITNQSETAKTSDGKQEEEKKLVETIIQEVKPQVFPLEQINIDKTNTENKTVLTKSTVFNFINYKQLSKKVKLITVLILILLLGSLGFWWYWKKENSLSLTSPPTSLNLEDFNPGNITAIAIEKFSEGNLTQGILAVSALLDQGLLNYAQSALTQVPPQQLNDPEINFLFGRLAWQSYGAKNNNYSLDDAIRYWKKARQENPHEIKYYNALAFAYYAQGQPENARLLWYEALDLINIQKADPSDQNTLNTYAGLALVLKKIAQNYSGKQRQDLMNQAFTFRDQVMKNNALKFQAETLGKPENWLWSETAINDWVNFLQ